MRNVYEVLTMIKEDLMEEKRSMYAAAKAQAATAPPVVAEKESEKPQETAASEEHGPSAGEPATEEPGPSPEKPVGEVSGPSPEAPESTPPGEAPVPDSGKAREPGKGILAEKFSAASSINDNLAGKRPAGTEARLAAKPIDNIHRNIGINDRFLIIRELFKGDADSFRDLINDLDEAGDLQKATALLHQRFPDSTEHEGLVILEGLIKRRFTTV
ncbi:MAG: hypothetical protein ACWGNV_02230 [Bacteroidales bacterium]